MGIFGGIGGVKTTEQKGVFLPAGNHELVIERCKLASSKVGNKSFFIVESTVMETSRGGGNEARRDFLEALLVCWG